MLWLNVFDPEPLSEAYRSVRDQYPYRADEQSDGAYRDRLSLFRFLLMVVAHLHERPREPKQYMQSL